MVECGQCNKLNCKPCIQDWTKKANTCPNCRREFTPAGQPNRFVVNMLNEFKFACTKCPETYKYSDHKKHIQECSNMQLRCPLPLCGTTGNQKTLLTHWHERCEQISLNCSSCKQATTRANERQHDCVEGLLKLRDEQQAKIN